MFVSSKGAKALPVAPREANLQRDPPNRICSWDYNLLVGRKFFWCFITAHYFFPSGSSSCGYVHGIIICCQAAAPKEVRRLQRPISHKRIIRAERGPELYMFMGLQSRSGSGFFYAWHSGKPSLRVDDGSAVRARALSWSGLPIKWNAISEKKLDLERIPLFAQEKSTLNFETESPPKCRCRDLSAIRYRDATLSE